MKRIYGTFCGGISDKSVECFVARLAALTDKHPDADLHLLFQSTGGEVGEGICLYNVLRKSPIEITVYNAGSVQSIALAVYLGAKTRVASKTATFMTHRVLLSDLDPTTVENLAELVKAINMDNQRIHSILRAHSNLATKSDWLNRGDRAFWFTAQQAIAYGVADRIGDFSPPKRTKLLNFFSL